MSQALPEKDLSIEKALDYLRRDRPLRAEEVCRDYLAKHPDLQISLLHIDVDAYEPSKLILEKLWDRIVPGGILMLDDYQTVEGETKAVDEFFKDSAIKIKKPDYYHIPAYIVKS